MIAGTGSGCGKTTVCCALLRLLADRGVSPSAYKCGPDYIDPLFLGKVAGKPCHNLDSFFLDGGELCGLLAETHDGGGAYGAAGESGIAVLEGVMGYYDGTGEDGLLASSYDVAVKTDTPVVLVVNARGSSTSILAMIEGFVRFRADSRIVGVILNMATSGSYEHVKALAKRTWTSGRLGNVRFLGYVPRLPQELVVDSRHLGLVMPSEIGDFQEKMSRLAKILETTIDVDEIVAAASGQSALRYVGNAVGVKGAAVKIAVARDSAFCFMYAESLGLLEALGAQLVFYSPLADEAIPDGACGLILSGGYPENHLGALSNAKISLQSVRSAIQSGMPCIAECGGYMYLSGSIDGMAMAGVLPGHYRNKGRLVRFGYVTVSSDRDSLLLEKGGSIRAHEFHYYDCVAEASGEENGTCHGDMTATKPNGRLWRFGYSTDTLYAGFPHVYLPSNVGAAERFLQKCREYGKKHLW